MKIDFKINGKDRTRSIAPSTLLIDLIRDELKLKGTKPGCLEGECGACTVLVDGNAINSCLYLAVNIEGKSVVTIEGLGNAARPLDIVQQRLIEHGGVQCGFCTSGMVMSIKSYRDMCVAKDKVPNRKEVAKSLEGNLCRCTGYVKIVDAAISVYEHEENS